MFLVQDGLRGVFPFVYGCTALISCLFRWGHLSLQMGALGRLLVFASVGLFARPESPSTENMFDKGDFVADLFCAKDFMRAQDLTA